MAGLPERREMYILSSCRVGIVYTDLLYTVYILYSVET